MPVSFSLAVYQNEYLPEGASEMHAVVSVTSRGGAPAAPPVDKAVVLVVDTSGSMASPRAKLAAARQAAAAAIELLPDDTLFALVAGTHEAHVVYPLSGYQLARADGRARAEAVECARRLRAGGGTAISTWIDLAGALLDPHADTIRLAYLLTDGVNAGEPAEHLDAAIERSIGLFQCDTRGVGDDWDVAELRKLSSALLGEVDIIKSPERMVEDFQAFMGRAIGKNIGNVRLRLWVPKGSNVRFLRQAAPVLEDLAGRGIAVDEMTCDYPTGAWSGDEARDYHVCVDAPPGEVGDEKLVARVRLMVGEEEVCQGMVRAVWTDDVGLSTRTSPRVEFFTGRAEQAGTIQEALRALERGEVGTATVKFGRAVQLAEAAGDDATLKLLRNVVEIDDALGGTVRVKHHIQKVDAMELDTRSTRTVVVGRWEPVRQRGGVQ